MLTLMASCSSFHYVTDNTMYWILRMVSCSSLRMSLALCLTPWLWLRALLAADGSLSSRHLISFWKKCWPRSKDSGQGEETSVIWCSREDLFWGGYSSCFASLDVSGNLVGGAMDWWMGQSDVMTRKKSHCSLLCCDVCSLCFSQQTHFRAQWGSLSI